MIEFRMELENLINNHSLEKNSDTPDFILAEYLTDCLETFDKIIKKREKWYNRESKLSSLSNNNLKKETNEK